jgi:hypothetical protein
MKKMPLIFAALLFTAAAGAQSQPDLIAQIHFAGADRIAADTNSAAFSNEFCSAEARALELQTLDKLSRAPATWFKSKIAPGADGAAQLRPLLDDLPKSEWIFEMRDATNGSPEYALAIRLNEDRAQLWSKNLAAVLQGWTGIGISQDRPGTWWLKKHEPPNLIQFSRSGDWVVIDCGQDNLSLRGQIVPVPAKPLDAETNWLTADLDWPRLARIFPALNEFDFPKIQMQAVGIGGNLQLTGRLALAQPLPPLDNWRLPAATIRQQIVSFTAARGVAPWLARQPWMQPLEIQPQPEQLFIWALARVPFQTFAAEPVPDAGAALAQLDRRLSANTNWQRQFISPFTMTMTNSEISWHGMPFITPFVQAVREPAGDFLVGGFFPNAPKSAPLPQGLVAVLNQPGLVYYHWEVTAERLGELPQMSQLMLMLTRHRQLDGQSAAGKWLNRISPALGTTITEARQIAPNQLAFKRTAPVGLTALELLAFANWLDAPQFPSPDLRLPPPRIRPGQRPLLLPAMPSAAPAPAHP